MIDSSSLKNLDNIGHKGFAQLIQYFILNLLGVDNERIFSVFGDCCGFGGSSNNILQPSSRKDPIKRVQFYSVSEKRKHNWKKGEENTFDIIKFFLPSSN